MGSPAVLINHSMMQELNTPQTKFHSTVLGCCQACGRAACAVQRCSQGRRLDQQAAPGDTDQHYIVLGCTVGLSAEFSLMLQNMILSCLLSTKTNVRLWENCRKCEKCCFPACLWVVPRTYGGTLLLF